MRLTPLTDEQRRSYNNIPLAVFQYGVKDIMTGERKQCKQAKHFKRPTQIIWEQSRRRKGEAVMYC